MKIVHASIVDVSLPNGATEHVLGLAQGLGELGHEVVVLAPSSGEPVKKGKFELRATESTTGGFARAAVLSRLLRSTLESEQPDAVYLRAFPLDYWYVLRHLRGKRVPLIAELNTMARDEHRLLGYSLRAPVLAWFEGRTLETADAWAPVTNEIHGYAVELSRSREKPWRLAFNAFDATDLPELDVRQSTRTEYGAGDQDTVLVMAGFGYPWHGVDRAINAMNLLDDSHHLWLVGARDDSDRELVDLHATPRSRSRIKVFGSMPSEELIELFAGADVGLGSLAFDRHTLTEAQPMKVALYLALGLPVIINYNDVRLEGSFPFVGRMSSNEPKALVEALESLKPLTPALRQQAATYAAHHLSWREAARHTVSLIESLQ